MRDSKLRNTSTNRFRELRGEKRYRGLETEPSTIDYKQYDSNIDKKGNRSHSYVFNLKVKVKSSNILHKQSTTLIQKNAPGRFNKE
jgi:hypothetical protein